MDSYRAGVETVLQECERALNSVEPSQVDRLVEAMLQADRLFFVGVGRVLLSLQAMVKRLNHLGLRAYYVGQIDEPALQPGDLLVVGSSSGESLFPAAIAKKAKALGGRIAHIGSHEASGIAPITDIFVRIPVRTKLRLPDELDSSQPMTSLFEQCLFVFGDILAAMIIEKKGLDLQTLSAVHANLE